MAYLLNHTSCPSLENQIPLTFLDGTTQDIIALLCFHWFEPVYYCEDEASFPSESTECKGHFVGFADHVGHALTFAILTSDTRKIIYCSEVRTATSPSSPNLRANHWGDEESNKDPKEIICSQDQKNGEKASPMVIIDLEDLIGKTFKQLVRKKQKPSLT